MRLPAYVVPLLALATAVVSLLSLRVSGAPNGIIAIQAGAFVLAALIAAPGRAASLINAFDARWTMATLLLLAAAVLFAGVEIDGARRWLRIGPVLLHPASLFGGFLLLALARAPGSAPCAALAGATLLCFGLGNDGAASLAFALGLSGLLPGERRHWKMLLPLCVLAWCLAAWGWSRPDSLAPVPYVEEIVAHTWAAACLLGAAAAILLALLPLPFLLTAHAAGMRGAGYALAGFWAGLVLAGLFGNYPIPVIGYGASPVIGWVLALRLLSSRSP